MRGGQNINIHRSLGEADSKPHGLLLWEVQDFGEGNNCRCGGNSKRTGIRSGAMTNLLQSEDRAWMDDTLVLIDGQRKWFLGQAQWLTLVIPALWEAEAGGSPKVRSLKPAWPTWWNPISTKNTKISWVWWRAPVVPATREAEAGESLEPGS